MGGPGSGRKKHYNFDNNSQAYKSLEKALKIKKIKHANIKSEQLKGLYTSVKNYKGGG